MGTSVTPIHSVSGKVGVNTGDTVYELVNNAEQFNTWQVGSTAGAIEVLGSIDGTNYLSSPIALIDLASTTPSVAVVATSSNKHFGFRGRYRKLIFKQTGATAVANGCIIGTDEG